MKIRMDFVTNSSSASFVTYRLEDSEFCRYVYAKMKEKGIDYGKCLDEYNPYRPKSSVDFYGDCLYADICCQEEELNCDYYAPECFSPTRDFDIGNITAYMEEEAAQEEVKRLFEKCVDDDGHLSDDWVYSHEAQDDDDEICTINNRDFCSRLFTLLMDSKCRDNVIKEENEIRILDGETVYVKLTRHDVELRCSSDDYGGCEREEDIGTMTERFIPILSEFLPLEDIGEDEKLKQLFEEDQKNGKFTCNVYMGYTD